MRKITILALMAGAIISAGGASAQGVYLDFGNNPGPRYRDYDDGPRYRDYEGPYRDGSVTAIGATADTIGPADFGLLTDVRTVGPFKTASANHTGAIEIIIHAPNPPRLAAFNPLWKLAPLRRGFHFQVPGTK